MIQLNGCEARPEHRAKLDWAGDFQPSHRNVSVVCGSILIQFFMFVLFAPESMTLEGKVKPHLSVSY